MYPVVGLTGSYSGSVVLDFKEQCGRKLDLGVDLKHTQNRRIILTLFQDSLPVLNRSSVTL
jgi:hypothetical protein